MDKSESLWEENLNKIKNDPRCNLFNWQKRLLSLKFLNSNSKQNQVQINPINFTISIPSNALNISEDFIKVCLAHEIGHVVDCSILASLYIIAIISGLFGLCYTWFYVLSIIIWISYYVYRYKYNQKEKEYEADDMAVTLFGKDKVKLWLSNLGMRFGKNDIISQKSKDLLKKRIERLN